MRCSHTASRSAVQAGAPNHHMLGEKLLASGLYILGLHPPCIASCGQLWSAGKCSHAKTKGSIRVTLNLCNGVS